MSARGGLQTLQTFCKPVLARAIPHDTGVRLIIEVIHRITGIAESGAGTDGLGG